MSAREKDSLENRPLLGYQARYQSCPPFRSSQSLTFRPTISKADPESIPDYSCGDKLFRLFGV